jgi:hypothetical protein
VIQPASEFITEHSAFIGLLALAFVVTMREELPSPFNRLPLLAWFYGWLHDALKTFVSFRGPKSPQ